MSQAPVTVTPDDIEYMRRTADEYDHLLERWKHARAGSQEVANLHATFKARGGEVGRMVENGLFRRVLATIDARGVKTWQHDETGRTTEAAECPGPRWTEVPAGVQQRVAGAQEGGNDAP